VRSNQDLEVTREPEGWAGGGKASEEEGGECGSVRAAAQSVTPISSPLPRSWSRRSIDWRPMQPRHCPLAWPHGSVATDNDDETPSLSLTQPPAAPGVRGHTRLITLAPGMLPPALHTVALPRRWLQRRAQSVCTATTEPQSDPPADPTCAAAALALAPTHSPDTHACPTPHQPSLNLTPAFWGLAAGHDCPMRPAVCRPTELIQRCAGAQWQCEL
jgi:hypothetical protein